MSVEIEIKAWVRNFDGLKKKLDALGEYRGSFKKSDAYWYPKAPVPAACTLPPAGLRVRKEKDTAPTGAVSRAVHVTYKVKEIRDGMEINDEKEFAVSEAGVFEDLLACLGLEKRDCKRKKGLSYQIDGITAELLELPGLGSFIELEILSADDKKETVAAARSRLYKLLAELGIPETAVEPRYYTEMLRSFNGTGF
jgi:adenylate cyclase class 2